MYLPKFHENIFKYCQLDLFKEIIIDWLQQHLPDNSGISCKPFSTVFLFELVNAMVILAFSVARNFVDISLNYAPCMIIKGS